MQTCSLILAAGEGTRMKSSHPKVVHQILNRPLVNWVIKACKDAGINKNFVVIGNGAEEVKGVITDEFTTNELGFVIQAERLGTGHAAMTATDELKASGAKSVVILSGDSPLITSDTIAALAKEQENHDAAAVVLTMKLENPKGYGRVISKDGKSIERIVEEKDASQNERKVNRCNSGVYCFSIDALLEGLPKLSNDNAQGEYYLTDLIGMFVQDQKTVVAYDADDPLETLGVNSRIQLADASAVMRNRINEKLMNEGVTMIDPTQVWIGSDVQIGKDTIIYPQTFLTGTTKVGSDCIIGPNTRLHDTRVGNECVLEETVSKEVVIDNNVTCGPRAYLRKGTHLKDGCKVGTHVEIKNSTIGKGSKVPHLSYVGDTDMGADVNFGAGSITCNYDGVSKHKTKIGNKSFIGSDTMLVAPVEVGEGSLTGAGSVVSKNVPADALALERSDLVIRENYVTQKMETLKRKKNDEQ